MNIDKDLRVIKLEIVYFANKPFLFAEIFLT